MKMTTGICNLVNDAIKSGMKVVFCPYHIEITNNKSGTGIRIWDDGKANRTDVDLSVATSIRTQKQMRRVLGL